MIFFALLCLGNLFIYNNNLIFFISDVGSALVKCGETEKKLGQAERDLKAKSMSHFLHQLKNFLEGDMKTISVSRRFQWL